MFFSAYYFSFIYLSFILLNGPTFTNINVLENHYIKEMKGKGSCFARSPGPGLLVACVGEKGWELHVVRDPTSS